MAATATARTNSSFEYCRDCGRTYGPHTGRCPRDGSDLVVQPVHDPMIGMVLDDCYQVDAWIADGGMGAIYRGHQLLLDRPVAIKTVRSDRGNDSEAMRRFLREVRLSRKVSHPNIVRVYDGGLTEFGQTYLTMEYLVGKTLSEYVSQDGLELQPALDLFVQLCDGVEAIHQSGMLHRDLKPSNVFLTETRKGRLQVKILDFGLARQFDETATYSLTGDSSVLGTPGYLAPEQINGQRETDQRADIYALGALLAFMLTGTGPFAASSLLATINRQLFEGPSAATLERLARTPRIRTIVERALERDPNKRFPSVAAMREAVIETQTDRDAAQSLPRPTDLRPGKPRESEFHTDAIPLDGLARIGAILNEYPAPFRLIANSVLSVLRGIDGPVSTAEIRDRLRHENTLDVDAYIRVLRTLAEDNLVIAGIHSWRLGRI